MGKTTCQEGSPAKRRVIKDPEDQKKPPLRISHIVYGREKRGNRVYYLVDPKGSGAEKRSRSRLYCIAGEGESFPDLPSAGAV